MKSQNSPEAAKVQHTFKTNYILESCKPRRGQRKSQRLRQEIVGRAGLLFQVCNTLWSKTKDIHRSEYAPPQNQTNTKKIKSSLVGSSFPKVAPWSPRIFSSTLRLHRALSGASDPQGNSERLMVYWVFTMAFNKCECNGVYLQYYIYIYHIYIYTFYIYIYIYISGNMYICKHI